MERTVILENPIHVEFFKDEEKITKLAVDAVNKIGAKATSRFFYRFSETNPELVCQYIECLMTLSDKLDNNELKQIFRQFKHVMMYHSVNKLRFIRFGMDLYMKMMERNSGFYRATELGIETFFKLIYYD